MTEKKVPITKDWQALQVRFEQEELDGRRKKLAEFIGSNEFRRIGMREQLRLKSQASAMSNYSRILGQRIDAFVKPKKKAAKPKSK